MSVEPPASWRGTIVCGAVGLVAGLTVALLALGMSGAGHGWGSSTISAWAVLLFPVMGVAWSLRDRRGVFIAAVVIALSMLWIDLALVSATASEGTDYVTKVWSAAPGLLASWAVLWFGAHLLPVWIMVIALLSSVFGRQRAMAE